MEWFLGFSAIVLLIVGLIGQAFELRKIRVDANQDQLGSANIFLNKKNFKWYTIIIVGMIIWHAAERV